MSNHRFNCICPYCVQKKNQNNDDLDYLRHNLSRVSVNFVPTCPMKFHTIFKREGDVYPYMNRNSYMDSSLYGYRYPQIYYYN